MKMMKRLNTEKLHALLTARNSDDIAAGRVGGSALCVYQDDQLCFKGFFGTVEPNGAPVTEDTIFRLASMTKPITAVAALILCEEGKLDLNTPISRWLPDYAEQNIVEPDGAGVLRVVGRAKTAITPLHLLTHTSGLGSGVVGEIQRAGETDAARGTLRGMADFYADKGLAFEPFTTQMYSGVVAFSIMARIIEMIAQQDYSTFLQDRIFDPCGMVDTTFLPTDEQWARMITIHNYRDGAACVGWTEPGCVFERYPASSCLGGAGLISTLHDYSRFAEMLLNEGICGSTRVISKEAHALLCRAHVPVSGKQSWGLGVRVITDEAYGQLPVGTYGWSGAYGTHFWVDPVNRITAVYLKNSRYDGGAGCVTGVNFEKDVAAALV